MMNQLCTRQRTCQMPITIRKDHTLDRPEERITTAEIFDIAKTFAEPFTTCDLADYIVESGKYRGYSYERIERACRAAMSWLAEREIAYVVGEMHKITKRGCISRPFLYAIHPGRTWNRKTRSVECSYGDVNYLMQVLVMR